jgi:hypothetical protein
MSLRISSRFDKILSESFIFKKEIDLIEEIVPLTKFTSFLLYVNKPYTNKVSLPDKILCTRICKVNFNILTDFLSNISKDAKNTCVIPDAPNLLILLNNNHYFVYCLMNGNHVLAFYFFKNTHIQYEEYDDDVFQFVSSYNNTNSNELFFDGFVKALYLLNQVNKISLILYENIYHNMSILEKTLDKHHVIFKHECAYYLYNAKIPGMPINNKNFFCIL